MCPRSAHEGYAAPVPGDWLELETVDVSDGTATDVVAAFKARHPHIREEDLRVDLMCGRDHQVLRFWRQSRESNGSRPPD